MRVINAVWEKRNLGVDCVEFEFSKNEDLAKAKDLILDTTCEYQIAKVPVGKVEAQLLTQECGFKFYETNIQIERKLTDSDRLPKLYSRYASSVTYRDATNEEVDNILQIVAQGNMFTTDKVAQDPYFSSQLSGKRYSLWARDLLNKDAKTVIGCYKGKPASFTIYEEKEGFCLAFIGGMFDEYKNKGLGFIPLYVTGEQIYENGGRLLKTGVSSNNPAILRLHLLFGGSITEMTNIYIKHM